MARQKRKGGCGTILLVVIILAALSSLFGDDDNKNSSTEITKSEEQKHKKQESDSVWSDNDTSLDEFDYYVNGNEIHLKQHNGDSTKIKINSTYELDGKEYDVVSLEDATFFCDNVISVIISEGVKNLEDNTFNGCDLEYLYLPSTIENLESSFWGYFHDVKKIYYGGSKERWDEICQEPREKIDVKQIFCNVNPDILGTDAAEKEAVVMGDNAEGVQEEESSIPWDEKLQADLKTILAEDVANKAYDIIVNQIGFTEVEYIGQNEVGDSNYDFNAESYYFTLTASDDVYRIFQPSGGAVFYEDGTVKQTISELNDKVIDSSDQNAYYIMAKAIVESCLVNPGSADFPSIVVSASDIKMQRKGDIVGVQSYVDSKNALGTVVRSQWLVEFQVIDINSFSYNTLYVQIDGETTGEFIDLN